MTGDVTISSERGRRDYQEDTYIAGFPIKTGPNKLSSNIIGTLLGVFDGHGSDSVSEICQKEAVRIFGSKPGNPLQKLRATVAELAKETLEHYAGSTLSLVFIPNRGETVHCAVLGDSPIVIRDAEGKINVSPDHNVRSNPVELEAATERGGLYMNGYIYRGFSSDGLQMGRALGDAPLGKVISKIPDIYSVKLGPKSFILLASDGCFDPSHEETELAVNTVVNMIDDGAVASTITKRAVEIPTWDNATAVLWKRMKP